MKFRKIICILASVLVLFSGVAVSGVSYDKAAEEWVTFIVEVEGDPTLVSEQAQAMGAESYAKTKEAKEAEASILKKQAAVVRDISNKVQAGAAKGYTYTALFNGFSVEGKLGDLEAIAALPGVKNVYVSQKRYLQEPRIDNAEEITGVPQVADTYGLKGEGQVVAVIDSEFDTSHEFFAEPVESPKYTKDDIARILSEETMNVSVTANRVYRNSKIPFAYDYAQNTADTFNDDPGVVHGTHVAGITAGKNGTGAYGSLVSGVAPEAQLILMKATDQNGAFVDAAILAAIDDASKLGVSAINMSLGSDYMTTSHDIVFQPVLDAARNAGIFLSVAAGNSSRGYQNYTPTTEDIDYAAAGTPNSFSAATSVASVDNLVRYYDGGQLMLSDGSSVPYTLAYSGSEFSEYFAGDTRWEYVYCGYGKPEDFQGLNLSGKIALVKRGENNFPDKSDNAKAAGAEGIIIWNNANDVIQTANISLPGAVVSLDSGQFLLDAENKMIKVTEAGFVSAEIATVGKPSSFTSWGTNESLELKPEISAPGGYIYSSVPNDKYHSLRGTSMAAPHITGLVALMNQFYSSEAQQFINPYADLQGDEKVSLFENLLMSSAVVTEEEGIPYSPRLQGAGLANIKAALTTPTFLQGPDGKAKISLGSDIDHEFTLHFLVKNLTDSDVVYDELSLDVTTDGYIEDEGEFYVDGTQPLSFQSDLPQSVTVPAGGEAELTVGVTLNPDELLENEKVFTNGFYIDGFVTLASSAEIPVLSIPFTGFRGDWRSAPIFDTTIYDEGGSSLYIPGLEALQGTFLYSDLPEDGLGELGQNQFSGEEDIINREYIAFSPNGDGVFDTVYMCIQPLRSMSYVEFNIFNADGECVITESYDKSASKFHTITQYLEECGSLADGNYTLRVSGVYDHPGVGDEFDDYFELPLVVDTQKPHITEVKTEGNILTVTANDNHYVSAIVMEYVDDNGEGISVEIPFDPLLEADEDGVCTAEFDISGIDKDTISIEVYDYALNDNGGKLSDITDDISVQLTEFNRVLGMTAADITLTNRTETEVSGTLLAAFYDADDHLIHAEYQDAYLAPGEQTYQFRMAVDTEGAATLKVFFWDKPATMQPLIEAKEFDIP